LRTLTGRKTLVATAWASREAPRPLRSGDDYRHEVEQAHQPAKLALEGKIAVLRVKLVGK
jgi:hypothetical protein